MICRREEKDGPQDLEGLGLTKGGSSVACLWRQVYPGWHFGQSACFSQAIDAAAVSSCDRAKQSCQNSNWDSSVHHHRWGKKGGSPRQVTCLYSKDLLEKPNLGSSNCSSSGKMHARVRTILNSGCCGERGKSAMMFNNI